MSGAPRDKLDQIPKIKITPVMLKAGVDALHREVGEGCFYDAFKPDVAKSVFRAMMRAMLWPRSPPSER